MKILPILVLGLTILPTSCSKNATGGNGGSELAKFENNLKALVTEERVRQVVDPGEAELQMDDSTSGRDSSLMWSWPSDRVTVTDLGFTKIETPDSNQFGISQFRSLAKADSGPKTGKEYVEQNYRSISPEEMQRAHENMKLALEERVKKGEITAEQAELAGGLGGAVTGSERVVETIDGIADACRWVAKDNTLAIGTGDVFFSIHAKISDESAENRAAAIKFAKLILSARETGG